LLLKRWASRIIAFALTFLAVAWAIVELPRTNLFWSVFEARFDKDQRYQVQGLFLPDPKRDYPLVVIGDALFQAEVPDDIGRTADIERVVINSYDTGDLRAVFQGLYNGRRATKSEACSLIVQVSPTFAIRSKAIGPTPEVRFLRDIRRNAGLGRHVNILFDIQSAWAATKPDMDSVMDDADRSARHVGQTQFADPNHENWTAGFRDIHRHRHPVLLVLDTRGPQWLPESDAIAITRSNLDSLAEEHDHVSWINLTDLKEPQKLGCGDRS